MQGIVGEAFQPAPRARAAAAHVQEFVVVAVVAHAGDVAHQLARRDGPRLFGKAGHVVAHRRVEAEQAALDEQTNGRGGHRFGNASDTEQRAGRHEAPLVDIGPPEALGPDDLSGDSHRERQPGEVLVGDEGTGQWASPLDGVGVRGRRGLVDFGTHGRGVVAVDVEVAGAPGVDRLADRAAGGEQRCGQ
ncbi:MAG: hypothetical protein QF463_13305 [Vicinamibacterales bacterium]|nr:hypothetical protein [Vicinamibacterales bacterium]